MKIKDFSAAIFDMDGLLLDSERLALETFRKTCDRFNTGNLSDLFIRLVGTNLELGRRILGEGLAGIVDPNDFEKTWHAEYRRVTSARPVPLKEGVPELLAYLESEGVPMAVATSTATAMARDKLERSGILPHFERIIGGDRVQQSKPAPDIYLAAAAALAVTPAECLALEDSSNGVKAAVAAGMSVVQVPDLVLPDETLLRLGHTVLKSLLDIVPVDFINHRNQPSA